MNYSTGPGIDTALFLQRWRDLPPAVDAAICPFFVP
jgi:hypothetical protein